MEVAFRNGRLTSATARSRVLPDRGPTRCASMVYSFDALPSRSDVDNGRQFR